MNNTVENDFLGFRKVKWLHLTGEVRTADPSEYEVEGPRPSSKIGSSHLKGCQGNWDCQARKLNKEDAMIVVNVRR